MKSMPLPIFVRSLAGWAAWTVSTAMAGSVDVHYEVVYKDSPVATQTLTMAQTDGCRTLTSVFEAELPVFISLQHYSEQLSVSFQPDGTVTDLHAVRIDGPLRTEVTGTQLTNGLLQIVRADRSGTVTSEIARTDYDFNSLTMYGTAPAAFLSTNRLARVLDVAEGRVDRFSVETIAESDTFERQHLASTHLVWTCGPFVSHSWHPERFSDLPRRFIRQTENGEFTFNLMR